MAKAETTETKTAAQLKADKAAAKKAAKEAEAAASKAPEDAAASAPSSYPTLNDITGANPPAPTETEAAPKTEPEAAPAPTTKAPEPEAAKPATAAPAPVAGPAPAPAKRFKIHPSRFHLDANQHNTWCIHPEHGVPFEAMLEPEFWAHIGDSRLKPGDTIVVYPADNSYRAELVVRASGRLFAHVAVWQYREFAPIALNQPLRFETRYLDAQQKWGVVRLSDRSVMQAGFDTQDQAVAWLGVHSRSLAA